MRHAFSRIALADYVELHMQSNPVEDRADLVRRLKNAVEAARGGRRCACGEPIWVIGSAVVGYGCFACITGEAVPDNDYEIAFDEPLPKGAE